MILRHLGRMLAWLGLAASIAACAALQPPKAESPNLYVLTANPLGEGERPPRDVVIEVSIPRAWPGFDTPQMAYVQQPFEIAYFASNRWADTPSRMLGPVLARALEQTRIFRAVVQAPSGIGSDLRLDTEIVRLQQNFAFRPSRAEFTLRAQLSDVRTRRVVASRTFEEVEDAPSDNAAGGAAAANTALQRMLERIADFCVAESAPR